MLSPIQTAERIPMNKTTGSYACFAFFANAIVLMLTSCGVAMPTITPIPQLPTVVPPYVHYIPLETSNVHLEFDYPGSWLFSEEKIQDTDTIIVGLGDPRLLTVPTRAPDEPHGTPSDFGSVSIWIDPVNSNQTLDVLIEPYKQGHSDQTWIKILDEYKITIDEYDAIVLEYQIEPIDYNGYTSLMFARDMFFVVKDQLYQIAFTVAEKERGGEFEQGYEYFFKSLKIVP